MLYKRFMVLGAGCLLFLIVFIGYSELSHKQMEDRFRAEREKYHQNQLTLTSTEPASTQSEPSVSSAPVQTNAPAAAPASAPDAAVAPVMDTNAAPGTPAAPAPAPATNTPPTPSSTMIERNASPFFQLASYHPSDAAGMANPIAMVVTQSQAQAPASTGTEAPAAQPSKPVPSAIPAQTAPESAIKAVPATTKTAPVPPLTHSGAAGESSVIVLLYHQFKPAGEPISPKFQWTMHADTFESEMKYIHDNGYNVISMADLLKFLHHEGTVPPRAVVITIDDGYKSAVVYAAPILKKYGFPWTFFIYPDFITVGEGPGAASWNDLLQLQAEGVDIESHSMTHPNLKLHRHEVLVNGKKVLKDLNAQEYADWLKNETAGSKAVLEQHLGKPVTCFAYPYGEYNTQVEQAVIDAGYDAIFTVADNPVDSTTQLHSIGRYTITQGTEKDFAAYLRQGALGLSDVDPAPGTTITNPRPVITATLGYPGALDPTSLETTVTGFQAVRHDFDPQTNVIRVYLPHDLIEEKAKVRIQVKDASTGQTMAASWHFNYQPPAGTATPAHTPISGPSSAKKPNTPPAPPLPAQPSASATPVPAATAVSSTH